VIDIDPHPPGAELEPLAAPAPAMDPWLRVGLLAAAVEAVLFTAWTLYIIYGG
jgi:hypothetical protein